MIEELITQALNRVIGVCSVDAVVMPQDAEFPRIRYAQVTAVPINDHASGDHCDVPEYQIDVFAYDYRTVKKLASDVRSQMAAEKQFTSKFLGMSGDRYEQDTRLFVISQDFRVWS